MEYDTKDKTFWKRKGNDMKVLLGAVNAKYIHSNLAVYCLKAYAEKYGDTSDEISIGEYTINQQLDEILRDIYKRKPDMLCLSCYIWNLTYVEEICREIKKVMPQIIIWIGGPEVSYDGVKVLERLPEVDGVMKGEGEQTFCDLLHFYQDKTVDGLQNMKGIVYREQTGQIVENEWRKTMDLSKVPFVYENMELFEHKIIYYETSRGCPFSCSYCLSSIDKKLRFRPLDTVKKELAFFLEQRVPQVKFVDRTFNCKKSHAMAIWQFIRDHDNGVTNFHFEIAADILDEEEIALLKTMRPGLVQLEIGVQTANPDTIHAINRKMDLARVAQVTETIRQSHNIHQHLDLIAGLPLEDYESFGHSFDVVYQMKPSQLQLGFLKVLKGSPMQAQASQYGILSQAEPPYEVLKTPWLSYDDIIRLKGLEEMVETYYNSGQFSNTVKVLCKQFDRPFLLYEALSDEYRARKMHEKKHSREAQYQFIRDFAAARTTLGDILVRQVLTLDYYLRDYARKRPLFALEQDSYKEEIRAVCLKAFPESSYKDVIRDYHIEVFVPPFTDEKQFVLFDYQHRDPLDQNAEIRVLT